MASDIARIFRPPAVLPDGAPIVQEHEVEPNHPWWVGVANLVPEPPKFLRARAPWALLGLIPQARALASVRDAWLLLAGVGPAARAIIAGLAKTGPAFGVRVPLTHFLHEQSLVPFQLADPRIEGAGVTGLWYDAGVWRLSATAVRRLIAAELRLGDTADAPATGWQAQDGWISLPSTFLWRPDAGDLLELVLLKLLLWHAHPRVVEWAGLAPDHYGSLPWSRR